MFPRMLDADWTDEQHDAHWEKSQAWYKLHHDDRCEAPTIERVQLDNPHGSGWHVLESGKTGDYDREHFGHLVWIRFESEQGFWADYFGPANVAEGWTLGAN